MSTSTFLPTSQTSFPTSHYDHSLPSSSSSAPITPYFFNNTFVASTATSPSPLLPVHDPATNRLLAHVPQLTPAELSAAVAAASAAFPAWRATTVLARQQIMFRFVALIRAHWDRLAAVITLEQGKTLADARGDVLRGLQVAEAACAAPELLKGEVLEVAHGMETRTYREPLGVVAAICPFNFPAMIPLWSIPLALVTGNTLVLKPSERDPAAALILAELAAQAGVPPGVLNIVHGARPTVDFLLDHPAIKALSFVGSNPAGEYIYARASAQGKRVQANLGAKNHAAVLADCDKAHFIDAVVGAAFGAAGQRCMALSTLVFVGAETKKWLPDLVARAKQLKLGPGFDPNSDVGPVISPASRARIEEIIASAEAEGARIVLDGRIGEPGGATAPAGYVEGNWVGPTIISDVTPRMRCYREEIFGPVLVCVDAATLDDAMALINANEYGNGTTVFTQSGAQAEHFRRNIEAGQIGINVPIPVPLPMFSFTGNKRSVAGGGANTFYGRPGIAFYTQTKTVTVAWGGREKKKGKEEERTAVTMPTQE